MAENSNHLILPMDALGQKLNGSRGRPFLCSEVLEPQAGRTKKAGSDSDGGAGVIWKLLDLHIPVACAGFGSAGTVDTNM